MSDRWAPVPSLLVCWLLLWFASCANQRPHQAHPQNSQEQSPAADAQAFRYARPDPGPTPGSKDIPRPQVSALDNGFELRVLPWSATTVALRVSCRVGGAQDPLGKAGVASLMTRMLTEGTESASALEQAIAFEDLGAGLKHATAHESLSLETEVLPRHVSLATGLLAEALRTPGFRDDDFERVRAERLDDLRTERQDPDQTAWLLAQRALLGEPWGRSTTGSPEDVEDVTQNDLVAFHAAHVTPERCGLLVAGTEDVGAVRAAARAAFEDWQPPAQSRAPALDAKTQLPREFLGKVLFQERPGATQSSIVVAKPFPPRAADGRAARLLVNNLFGGLFTSRLNANLREKNAYTYGAFSLMLETRQWGALFLISSVETEVTSLALEQMQLELARLALDPPTRRELDSARADLLQHRKARLEHGSRLLLELQEGFVFQLAPHHFANLEQRLCDTTAADLRPAANLFAAGSAVVVIVGAPAARIALEQASVQTIPADPAFLQ